MKKRSSWFVDYLRESFSFIVAKLGIHGINFVAKPDFNRKEKAFWIFMTTSLTITSGILLWFSLFLNSQTPIVTVVESIHYPTHYIPFPAVTICNFNRMSYRATMRIVKNMKYRGNYSDIELAVQLKSVFHFTSNGGASDDEYNKTNKLLVANNLTIEYLMDSLMPYCTSMINKCYWRGVQVRCDTLFQPIITFSGRCCSFNFLAFSTSDNETKPRRVSAVGYNSGLSVLLQPEIDDYFLSTISSYGFRIFVHESYNFPDNSAPLVFVQNTREALISVIPEATYSMNDIRAKDTHIRGCYHHNEVPMVVMARYSFINCMSECRMLIILHACGCVPYNFPRNASIPVCQLPDIKCYRENAGLIRRAVPYFNRSLPFLWERKQDEGFTCKCLPPCDFYDYSTEMTSGGLALRYSIASQKLMEGIARKNQSLVHVFFSDYISTRYRRDLFQSWVQVISMFGGLTGLFLGFSMVTMYEFVYVFFFKRLFDSLSLRSIARHS